MQDELSTFAGGLARAWYVELRESLKLRAVVNKDRTGGLILSPTSFPGFGSETEFRVLDAVQLGSI